MQVSAPPAVVNLDTEWDFSRPDAHALTALQGTERIPNPFLGVRTRAPTPSSPMTAPDPPPTNREFMVVSSSSKDSMAFPVPLVLRLIKIMIECKELRFFDTVSKSIVTEIISEGGKFLKQVELIGEDASISSGVFNFLDEYQQNMVRKLRVLCARPVDSASQRALLAPLIAFVTEFTDTKGYGNLFPIDKKKYKPKEFKSDYRNSFRDNSGDSPSSYSSHHSPYRGDNSYRSLFKKDDYKSNSGYSKPYDCNRDQDYKCKDNESYRRPNDCYSRSNNHRN
jgi:hypothetical protein